ncbi:glycosyltransferase [Erythrobacter sp.]|nr:glycosyltransferase [Erythrobacter sp.]
MRPARGFGPLAALGRTEPVMSGVSIVIPVFNEELGLPDTLTALEKLNPKPSEILVVDGGSEDRTVRVAEEAGVRCIISPKKGRGAQVNFGASQAQNEIVCVLHADTILPIDAVTVIQQTLADRRIALASFTPRVVGEKGTRWGSTLHNWVKTWYIPMLARPRDFLRGARLLYGDHAMFFWQSDFLRVGGCDERAAIMEEAELCLKLAKIGRVKIVPRWVLTSDRRIARLGRWRANWLYCKVGVLWAMGKREALGDQYHDIR